jgi:hypothetical protein
LTLVESIEPDRDTEVGLLVVILIWDEEPSAGERITARVTPQEDSK